MHRHGLPDQLKAYLDAGWLDYQRDHGAPKGHFVWIHKLDYDATRPLTFIWQPDLEAVLAEHAEKPRFRSGAATRSPAGSRTTPESS